MRGSLASRALGVLGVLAVAIGCRHRATRDETKPEPIVEPLAQQATPPEQHPEGDKPGYIGVLAPRKSAEVFAPFTSSIAELAVHLGDSVQAGQPLARLDDRPIREQLAVAAATLKASQADAAHAYVDSKAARAALNRENRALHENVVSKAEVSAAEFTSRKSQMAVAKARATVEEERAKIAALKARLVDTTLLAPLAGRVALLYVNVGDHIDEGQPVVRVISSDELFVKFAIPADKVGTVAAGDEVEIVIEQQGVKTAGVVRHVAPELDPVAQMILADAELTAPPPKLESGIVCRILIRDKHPAKP